MVGTPDELISWNAAILLKIPDCAKSCLAEPSTATVESSCRTVANNDSVINCVLNACTLSEAIFTRNVTAIACAEPIKDKSQELLAIILSFGLVTSVLTTIRLIYKLVYGQERWRLGWDDLMVAAAAPVAITGMALILRGLGKVGLGKSVWALPADDMLAYGIELYFTEIMYLLALTMIKLTLTIFYMSIFPSKATSRLLWGTVIFHVTFGLAFIIKTIFQCTPISYSWTRFDTARAGLVNGHCVQIGVSVWVHAAVNVAADFWMIGIPLFEIRKLQLRRIQKIEVSLMFMTGFL
ncbi:hypothetical protein QQS21_008879 [Conoideocrella luteorostrata]|uniref:Rhodopsin domain-containing protein n=1 Tax=Conoideocrella luteorostrata TaxID=1105319 RepID=A0AAJ0FW58_9HYPO|nr:hypothetical protein QQS21_008879 [Conoideocrella luteorostrata]